MPKAKAAVTAPQTLEEADHWMLQLGQQQREHLRITTHRDDEIADIRDTYEGSLAPLEAHMARLQAGLQAYGEANKSALLEKGKRTVFLTHGEMGWRTHPPKVALSKIGELVERLKNLGKTKFLRTTETIDKEAILKSPQEATAIKGIRIAQKETFFVEPYEKEPGHGT